MDLQLSLTFSLTWAWELLHLALTRTSRSRGVQPWERYWPHRRSKVKEDLSWPKPTVYAWCPHSRRCPPPLSLEVSKHQVDRLGSHAWGGGVHKELPPSSTCLNSKSTGVLGAHVRGGGGPEGAPTLPGLSKHHSNQLTTDRTLLVALDAHAWGEVFQRQHCSSSVCLNIKAINALGAHARRKRPPPFSLSRCLNTKTTRALGAHALGGGIPKDTATHVWSVHTPRCLVYHWFKLSFRTWCPRSKEAPPATSFRGV